jgi:prepilin-type N-terminal cleavage/methylation domain-containing protein
MIQTYRKLQRQRAAGEIDGGFTLIELLIVIVVLGILAAIVVFALGGVTGKSTVAACQSDAKTIGTGVAALQAENPTATPTQQNAANTTGSVWTTGSWQADLLSSTALTGGPFVQSWPTGNSASYTISVSNGSTTYAKVVASPLPTSGTSVTATSAGTFPNGDVIVTGTGAATTAQGYSYDATADPVEACAWAITGKP